MYILKTVGGIQYYQNSKDILALDILAHLDSFEDL